MSLGNSQIDTKEPHFSQREAAGVSGVPMGTINNWIDREYISLSEPTDRRLAGRRFFSIRDIVVIRAMYYCTNRFGLPPSYAATIAHSIATNMTEGRQPQGSDGKFMSTWFLVFRVLGNDGKLADGWGHDYAAYDASTGQFLDYNDASKQPVNPVNIVSGFLAIPSSKLANHTFLQCADILSQSAGNPKGLVTQGLPPMDF